MGGKRKKTYIEKYGIWYSYCIKCRLSFETLDVLRAYEVVVITWESSSHRRQWRYWIDIFLVADVNNSMKCQSLDIYSRKNGDTNHLIFPDAPKSSWLSGKYLRISRSTFFRQSPTIKKVMATSGRSWTTLAENAQSGLRCPTADEFFKICS